MSRKTRRIIALAGAVLLILSGIISAYFKIPVDQKALNTISTVIVVVCIILLVGKSPEEKENQNK